MTWKKTQEVISEGVGNHDKDRLVIQNNMGNLIHRYSKPLCASIGGGWFYI